MIPTELFRMLSDPMRLSAVLLISISEEVCVCDMMEALALDQPTTSRHLTNLRKAGILKDERRGKWVFYRLNPALPEWAHDLVSALTVSQEPSLSPMLTRLQTAIKNAGRCC